MKIIIFEDGHKLASQWVAALQERGHTATLFVGLSAIGADNFTGIDAKLKPVTDSIADADLAICDGLLAILTTPSYHAPAYLPFLMAAGIPCVSTSSGGDVTEGRGVHIEKEDILSRLDDILKLARTR